MYLLTSCIPILQDRRVKLQKKSTGQNVNFDEIVEKLAKLEEMTSKREDEREERQLALEAKLEKERMLQMFLMYLGGQSCQDQAHQTPPQYLQQPVFTAHPSQSSVESLESPHPAYTFDESDVAGVYGSSNKQ